MSNNKTHLSFAPIDNFPQRARESLDVVLVEVGGRLVQGCSNNSTKALRTAAEAEWSGVEWSGVEWSGVEWSAVQWSVV